MKLILIYNLRYLIIPSFYGVFPYFKKSIERKGKKAKTGMDGDFTVFIA